MTKFPVNFPVSWEITLRPVRSGLGRQPHSSVILARRETLRKSPDIPCVSSYRLSLWRPRILIRGPKSASFVGQSQFEIFQFPFLHPEVDQRLVCHLLRWSNRPVPHGELAESGSRQFDVVRRRIVALQEDLQSTGAIDDGD
jgi:hypothetical protein